jgi:hypothetical protein
MQELDCGCGYYLEAKDVLSLTIKVFLHLEAAHPEIEEPTMELTKEMVASNAYDNKHPNDTAQGRLTFPY